MLGTAYLELGRNNFEAVLPNPDFWEKRIWNECEMKQGL